MVIHRFTDERYALKTFRRSPGRRFEINRRTVENEVNILKRLSSHVHVVQVLGSYICRGELSIVLSPAANQGDLSAYLSRLLDSKMTSHKQGVLNRALGCLASGLAFIHKHTIRHKDVKPQNILIHHDRVLYADFGLSLETSQEDTTTSGFTTDFTRRYCAPEVIKYSRRNRKSDVYSLGCVFVEILDVLEPTIGLRYMDEVPYYDKLDDVRRCLSQAGVSGDARKSLLSICHDMLERDKSDRIDAASVLRRLRGLTKAVDLSAELFCEDCSATAACTDVQTPEVLVDSFAALSLNPDTTKEVVLSNPDTESIAAKSGDKRKSKGTSSIVIQSGRERSSLRRIPLGSSITRYYCTSCGEMGHSSSRCPNKCRTCGELYHSSRNCPNRCWACKLFGHYARDCPNKCDACGTIGHSKDDCPHRCWTCGEVGHFARDCKDKCFVCGRLGHGTQKCKGKCHGCGKIGHWRKDCGEACSGCVCAYYCEMTTLT